MTAHCIEFWRVFLIRGLAGLGMAALAACSGGIAETDGIPRAAAPAADLDTAKPPPQTVTQTPLLPPVPSSTTVDASPQYVPPPVEHLYTEDEQAKIEAELAAAAKAQK
ncbi:MAG: hypothetical protein P4L82_23095 [Ancalomicrobiaceae bacterium]|nr:hypothetical protein [Ancalomicrobiaceae bacterium]